MGDSLVLYSIEDKIAFVTLNHPPVNALDVETKEALEGVFEELDKQRNEIRVVVMRGAGEQAFAAGADIRVFLDDEPERAKRRLTKTYRIFSMVENFSWPTIAAIHGYCLGAGLELALCCDIRYADENAQFGFPETKLSVFPGNGGTKRGLYYTPLGRLKELVFTGDMISAREAYEIGLIEKVVPAGRLMDEVKSLAEKIKKRGPLGVAAAKKVINRNRDLTLEQGLELESDVWAALAATEDMKEGARAFLDKRKPAYKAR